MLNAFKAAKMMQGLAWVTGKEVKAGEKEREGERTRGKEGGER